jgi:hypothetical protein
MVASKHVPNLPDRRLDIGLRALLAYLGAMLLQAFLVAYIPVEPWRGLLATSVQWSLIGAAIAAACWVGLGDGFWITRLVGSLFALVWVWIVWQEGIYLADVEATHNLARCRYYVDKSLVLFVATAAGFAGVRWLVHLRFTHRDEGKAPIGRPQFTLQQSLIGMAIIAGTLGIARIVAPADRAFWTATPGLWYPHQGSFFFWTFFPVAVLTPVAIVSVFRVQWLPLAILYLLVVVVAVGVAWDDWRVLTPTRLATWTLESLAQAGVLLPHLVVLFATLRLMGYRLARRA